ncbi:MAG: ECF transporter S component [Oscillospiraceae bacterium]|nr:ECF transporter S component [Oscillospiraceae bacterium]
MWTTAAIFAALTCVLTFTVRIPTAIGYIHPGDGVIYLCACVLPFPYAIFAAAVGGAMSDLLAGFPQWIIPTLLIKSAVTLFFKSGVKKGKVLTKRNIIMTVPAGLVTVGGYFAASLVMYGTAGAFAEVPANFLQAGISAVVFVVAAVALPLYRRL